MRYIFQDCANFTPDQEALERAVTNSVGYRYWLKLSDFFESPEGLASASASDLMRVRGIGPRKSALIREAIAPLIPAHWQLDGPKIDGSLSAIEQLEPIYEETDQYECHVLFLREFNCMAGAERMAHESNLEALHNQMSVEAIFAKATELGARSLVISRNDPKSPPVSCDPPDRQFAKEATKIGRELGIKLHDYIVVSSSSLCETACSEYGEPNTYHSLFEHGHMP